MKNNQKKVIDINNRLYSTSPFTFSKPSISEISIRMLILLSIQILMLLVTKSYSSFLIVLSTFLGSLSAASLNFLIYKEQPYNFLAITIQGILIGLFLPSSYPPVAAFFITFATLFISRTIVFKNVNSWVNMVSVTLIIFWCIGRNYFPDFNITKDILVLKNPSNHLSQASVFPVYSFDSSITAFLNSRVFSFVKVNIPEGYISMLWDTSSSIPAFRFNIITIISSIILFADGAFSLIIPAVFTAVYGILIRLFSPLIFGGVFNQGDIILALCTSGTLFASVFVMQWFGTVPETHWGKILMGLFEGIVAFFIMGAGTSSIGMVYTILFGNIFGMMLRLVEEKQSFRRINKIKGQAINVG
ncbi:MAG: RnfABCDGE type electron transport complex subunit D [Treponema sp.]|nr:RnfABCDGE type electron transport complex subunit D [Treponema sp.]